MLYGYVLPIANRVWISASSLPSNRVYKTMLSLEQGTSIFTKYMQIFSGTGYIFMTFTLEQGQGLEAQQHLPTTKPPVVPPSPGGQCLQTPHRNRVGLVSSIILFLANSFSLGSHFIPSIKIVIIS